MSNLALASRLSKPGTLLSRNALVQALSLLRNRSADFIARERFDYDNDLLDVVRAATGTADTTTAGSMAELVGQDVQAFVSDLAPVSAYAALAERGLKVDLGSYGSVAVPFDDGSGTELAGAWVGEGGAMPVKRGALAAVILRRYKMGVITLLSEELERSSPANAEQFVRRLLTKHTARALDAHFLSANPGVVGSTPPGIVNGVAPIAANTGGSRIDNAVGDLTALVEAIVDAGNGERIVLVLNTAQRLALAAMRDGNQWMFRDELARGQLMGVEFVSSHTVPVGSVFAIDCENLITGLGVAEIDVSKSATLVPADAGAASPTHATSAADRTAVGAAEQVPPHGGLAVRDAAQQAAGKVGQGAVSVSMFQQMCVALRTVLPLSWATTRAGCVQWIEGVAW